MTFRPVCDLAADGSTDSVKMRRLKILHRSAIEQWRRDPHAPLERHQKKHWLAAMRDGLVSTPMLPARQSSALAVLNLELKMLAERESRQRPKCWRAHFATFLEDTLRAA